MYFDVSNDVLKVHFGLLFTSIFHFVLYNRVIMDATCLEKQLNQTINSDIQVTIVTIAHPIQFVS